MITCYYMIISVSFLFTEQQYRESLGHQGHDNRGIIFLSLRPEELNREPERGREEEIINQCKCHSHYDAL